LSTIAEGVGIAIDAVRGNKVRSGLTIMGVAVGVFVVVLIAAAVHGINQSVAKDFESAGPTTFFVSRYPISFENCDGTANTCRWLSCASTGRPTSSTATPACSRRASRRIRPSGRK
ncbi:MAG: hypothetical protein MUD17_12970, partial [Gemmatimonadaceae bacterium]|nr:hypothetical protein [Gemmatimonadaceae bacterium]